LLCYLCKYSSQKKKKNSKKSPKPDYLHDFLQYCVQNLTQYQNNVQQGIDADWRIKEAIMFAIGTIRDEIVSQKDLKVQMEQMLFIHILPEF
jgi:hypothetical protein